MIVVEEPIHWEAFAACRGDPDGIYAAAIDAAGTDDELAYPTRRHREICGRCPVLPECLGRALADPGLEGVWGDTTDFQRRQLRRKRVRERCPGCDSNSVVPENGSEICLACGISWWAA